MAEVNLLPRCSHSPISLTKYLRASTVTTTVPTLLPTHSGSFVLDFPGAVSWTGETPDLEPSGTWISVAWAAPELMRTTHLPSAGLASGPSYFLLLGPVARGSSTMVRTVPITTWHEDTWKPLCIVAARLLDARYSFPIASIHPLRILPLPQ